MRNFLQRLARLAESVKHPYAALSGIFLVSRIGLWYFRPMNIDLSNMHFLPTSFLKDNLLQGLYYMHAQPPFFNLFLGLVLKATPTPYIRMAFTGLYSLMALLLCLASYRMMEHLKISKGIRFWATLGIMFVPSTLQAETWLYFSMPVTLLLVLIVIALYRGLEESPVWGGVYLLLLSVLVMTRSAYHLVVWMIPMSLLYLALAYRQFGKSVTAKLTAWLVIVSILPFALYVRNYRHYGVFQSSTWIGFSAWSQVYYTRLNPDNVEKLIQDKKVTPLARIERYSTAEEYLAYYGETGKTTGIALFDQLHTPNGGINFNHFIFPRADMETYHNSIAIIKAFPKDYLKAVLTGIYTFCGFSPYRFFTKDAPWWPPKSSYGWVMAVIVPPLFLAMFVLVIGLYGRDLWVQWTAKNRDYGRMATFLFMLYTIAFMTAQIVLLVFPEANYIRIPMDPFLLVGLAIAIDQKLA